MMMKIGIMTFFHVYNYGAVLQAYSMQKILEDMHVENEIIDFYIERQTDLTDVYSTKNGLKRFIKTLLLTPFYFERQKRKNKFIKFISELNLSNNRCHDVTDLKETNADYDCFVAGSDQIWNVTKTAEASDCYFLDFVNDEKRKISYASSIGVATYEQLLAKKDYLKRFSALSCRESGGANILNQVVGRDIATVLDPTLLVDKKYLENIVKENTHSNYILYYSLDGYDKRNNNLEILKKLGEKLGLTIKFVTPEWPIHDFGEDVRDAGPKDFLGLIKNAALICTNSFHGTALSIKLRKPFFVLEGKNIKDERKRSILIQLGLEDRIISDVESLSVINNIADVEIAYEQVDEELRKKQKSSYDYLHDALGL